jgi:hypothetical protein
MTYQTKPSIMQRITNDPTHKHNVAPTVYNLPSCMSIFSDGKHFFNGRQGMTDQLISTKDS